MNFNTTITTSQFNKLFKNKGGEDYPERYLVPEHGRNQTCLRLDSEMGKLEGALREGKINLFTLLEMAYHTGFNDGKEYTQERIKKELGL